jgi:hypothetical protein
MKYDENSEDVANLYRRICKGEPMSLLMFAVFANAIRDAALEEKTADVKQLQSMLRSAMCLLHGLSCPGCKAQGREMAAPGKCCRDADCDAGWYGISCDEIKDFLESADLLMPTGTLAQIENPPEPVNECTFKGG